MLEIAIMIEGQNGLTWPRWRKIARLVEDAGFVGLFRSDHFTNAHPPDIESLELWTSLTWLAGSTQRIEFGPLVSPVSFRHPALTARMAAAVDDLSDGRLTLGLGAGWPKKAAKRLGNSVILNYMMRSCCHVLKGLADQASWWAATVRIAPCLMWLAMLMSGIASCCGRKNLKV